MQSELDVLAWSLGLQDAVITGQLTQIQNLNTIILKKDGVININAEEVAHWKKQYKKQRRQKFFWRGGYTNNCIRIDRQLVKY